MMRRPNVDISQCTLCEGCIELCPEVFSQNAAGYIEVADLDQYPEDAIDEAISMCPADCIFWEEGPADD